MSSEPDKQVEAYLAGEMEETSQPDLERRLRNDPAVRLELLRSAVLDVGLRQLLARQAEQRRRRLRRWLAPLGLAALLLAQIGGWIWFNRTGKEPTAVARPTEILPVPQPEQTAGKNTAEALTCDRPTMPPQMGVIVAVQGEASLISGMLPDEAELPLVTGMVVRAGARLRSGPGARVDFRYEDGSLLRLYAASDLMLTMSNGAKRVWVQAGALNAEITPQPADCAMEMAAAGLILVVRGTEFLVIAEEKAVWTGVRHGRVDVVRASDRQTVPLTEGRYVSTSKGWPFAPLPIACPYWQARCVARTGMNYR